MPLLDKASIAVDEGVTGIDGFIEAAGERYRGRKSKVCTLA
jgi:catalase